MRCRPIETGSQALGIKQWGAVVLTDFLDEGTSVTVRVDDVMAIAPYLGTNRSKVIKNKANKRPNEFKAKLKFKAKGFEKRPPEFGLKKGQYGNPGWETSSAKVIGDSVVKDGDNPVYTGFHGALSYEQPRSDGSA
ncbi:hypothetical protein AVEN_40355-1 [Araneus ventricosus]|uniref:Uncharacterized protein n=1 Tax=Araneus ventricosus TaxID=182803 RepID=A0A4Y2F479_ARAVE|nr:hypothetical protein AVEN_40355-1 [Araneus ventricosus]